MPARNWQLRSRLRHTLLGLAAAILCLVTACAPHSRPADKSPPLRLGTYFWPGSFWIDLAWKKGWFEEAGVHIERVDVEGNYFNSLDQVAGGTLDAVGFTHFDLVRLSAAGHDLVGVLAIDYSDGAEALIARPGIATLADLKGKRIGLRRGTYLEYLFVTVLEREGLDIADFVLVEVPTDQSAAHLATGQVDAVLAWEPYASQARQASGGAQLFSTADFPGLAYSTLALRKEFIDARPRDVQALVRVWRRATEYIRRHPDEVIALAAGLNNYPLADGYALMRFDRILDVADNDRAFSYAAGFDSLHGSWRRMNDYMLDRGLVARRVSSTDHLDSRFIRALDQVSR
jgi:NitT/TauT family transport system substrate-binding protein